MWLVVSEALLLVPMGIAIGVPAALAVARLAANQISGLLFGLEPADPFILATAALLWLRWPPSRRICPRGAPRAWIRWWR